MRTLGFVDVHSVISKFTFRNTSITGSSLEPCMYASLYNVHSLIDPTHFSKDLTNARNLSVFSIGPIFVRISSAR